MVSATQCVNQCASFHVDIFTIYINYIWTSLTEYPSLYLMNYTNTHTLTCTQKKTKPSLMLVEHMASWNLTWHSVNVSVYLDIWNPVKYHPTCKRSILSNHQCFYIKVIGMYEICCPCKWVSKMIVWWPNTPSNSITIHCNMSVWMSWSDNQISPFTRG